VAGNFLNLIRLFTLRPSAWYRTCFAAIPWMEWFSSRYYVISAGPKAWQWSSWQHGLEWSLVLKAEIRIRTPSLAAPWQTAVVTCIVVWTKRSAISAYLG